MQSAMFGVTSIVAMIVISTVSDTPMNGKLHRPVKGELKFWHPNATTFAGSVKLQCRTHTHTHTHTHTRL